MRVRTAALAVMTIGLLGLLVADATAICVEIPLPQTIRTKDFVVMFRGTVRTAHAIGSSQVATFDVTRVWKGDVGTRQAIYSVYIGDESITFIEGGDDFVAGYQMSAANLTAMGLPADTSAIGTNGRSARVFSSRIPGLSRMPDGFPKRL